MQKTGNEKPVDLPGNAQEDLTSHSPESRWLGSARAYRRIPIVGRIPAQGLTGLAAAALSILLAVLSPEKNCSCRDQFTDQKLEAMARQGNQAVKRYLAQKDNPINCAGRRLELLEALEKQQNRDHPKW